LVAPRFPNVATTEDHPTSRVHASRAHAPRFDSQAFVSNTEETERMRYLTIVCLSVGAAAILAVGSVASAKAPQQHVMTIALPFGGVETVHYSGDQPPTVEWSDMPSAVAAPAWSLGNFDHIAAAMNREMAALDQQMAALERHAAAAPDGIFNASTAGGKGAFCAESIQMTQTGNQAPHIVRHTYGACGAPDPGHADRSALSGGQRT
jgi:hypothetical protein